VVDKSKLAADFWVRMVWTPRAATDPDDHPIALVIDRSRFWLSLIAMIVAFLAGITLILVHASPLALVVVLVISFGAYRYERGGKSGYYEVRPDGGLGDYLGRRVPLGLKEMRPTRP
jgi:hypothetical protein